jgi:Fe(3+) dicitrate transport protein
MIRRRALLLPFLALSLCLSPSAALAEEEVPGQAAPVEARPVEVRPVEAMPVEEAPLPGIVVTGWAIPERRLTREPDIPYVPLRSIGSRDVFGPAKVRETGSRDLNDLVRHLPAMGARPYNGGEAAAPNFSMRGLPDDGLTEYVHVLIDGVPASPLPYGWTAFSFLPITPDRVYAADLIRGAFAVRYSPNTVGGILNLLTQPIPQCPQAGLRTTFGSYGYSSVMATAGGTWGRLGALATVVDRRGDGYREDGDFEQLDLNLKTRYDLGSRGWIAASLSWMDSEHQAPGGLTQAEFAADRFGNARPFNRFEGDRGLIDVVGHADLGCESWLEGYGYLSRTSRHLRAQRPHFGAPVTMSDWTDTSWFLGLGTRYQKKFYVGRHTHTLYGGVRYQREWLPHWRLASEPYPGGPQTQTMDAKYETDTLSLHVDDTIEINKRLTVQAGARVEWVPSTSGEDRLGGWTFDDDFFRVLPGFGASYALRECVALYANYFEGFRAPQVWGYGDTLTNGSLDFELGRSVEAGIRVVDWRGLTGSLTAWRVDYDNFGVYDSGFYENLGDIRAMGVDLVADWELCGLIRGARGFFVGGSLTQQDSELQSGPFAGNQTPYAWKTKAAWRCSYRRNGWLATLGGTYFGDSYSDDANTTVESADGRLGVNPAVTLWDARFSKDMRLGRRGHLQAAVGATNLFDNDWFVHSRGGFFGGGLVAGPPRQAYVSLDFTYDL